MATYLELQAEPWWGAEYIPPNLRILVERLQRFYELGWTHIGCKGDNNHLRGYHRSRAWILNSRFCTNRTYSVSRTPGDRSGGDANWLCAIDMTIPRTALLAACSRLDTAVKAGKLEKLTEWYGNKDGDSRVDGYDNIANQVASSDDSHLWHLHMSFDRGRANEDHADLYEILTGDTMNWSDQITLPQVEGNTQATAPVGASIAYTLVRGAATLEHVKAIEAKLDALQAPQVDAAAVAQALAANAEFLAALAKAVNDEAHRRSAE